MIQQLEKYIGNTKRIKALSAPVLPQLESPEQYEAVLREHFREISGFLEENRKILDDVLFPVLNGEESPDWEELCALMSACDALINGGGLDMPLSYRISRRLWEIISAEDDAELALNVCSMHAVSCCLMFACARRTFPYSDERERFHEEGCRMCDTLLSVLEYDRWSVLPTEDAKRLVLDMAAYKSAFYEGIICGRPKRQEENLGILRRALAVAEDMRYRDGLTEEQWSGYRQCVREYYGVLLEGGNRCAFSDAYCQEIYCQTEALREQWETEPDGWKAEETRVTDMLCYYRGAFFAGKLPEHEYKQKLCEIYQGRRDGSYEPGDVLLNLLLPVEYGRLVDREEISERESAVLEQMYRNAVRYIYRLPDSGVYAYVIDYLLQLLEEFREIPGGMSFEELVLDCMEALHPPTAVHSRMVAAIVRCLCRHLLRLGPELFFELVGTDSAEEVQRQGAQVVDFAYHAALCHDFGKLAVLDAVSVYGRDIFDSEAAQIRAHPELGAAMLEKKMSTAGYANVALEHHRWYDDSAGYPFLYEENIYPEKTIIDLTACADGMDAATDPVGRSWSRGKTLEEYILEVEAEAGTHYAPYLPELLRREEVRADLEYLLTETRGRIYRDTYVRLRERRG